MRILEAEWSEDSKPAYVRLRQLYEGVASRFAGKEESVLRQELIEPALQALGFKTRPGKKSGSSAAEPDYRLYANVIRNGLGQTVAPLYTGYGRGADRSCLDSARSALISRPAVAPASGALSHRG